MPRTVKGTALAVGDVIQDSANTGDTHPYVVIGRSAFQVTLRNCTSHETSGLTLVKILKEDKTGDAGWAGKDSYVVKSGNTTDLFTYTVVQEFTGKYVNQEMDVPELRQLIGPEGPFWAYVPVRQLVTVPQVVNRYSDIMYRVVGAIKAERMTTLLEELA